MVIFLISTFFLLVAQHIILVNEETLVLFCFIVIIYIGFNYFNFLTDSFFIKRSIGIKKKILDSFVQLEQALDKIINSIDLQLLIKNIEQVKNHCLKLTQNFIIWFLSDILNKIKIFYPKYFQSIKVIELKVIKLIIFFLFDKLTYTLTIMNFFKSDFFIQKIWGYNLLGLRESVSRFKNFYK